MNSDLIINETRRNELLEIQGRYCGGIERFSNLSVDILKILIDEKFISLDECQNCSPSTEQFYNFLLEHPCFTAHGYAVSPERNDYRITIEGIEGIPKTDKDALDFVNFAKRADELDCTDSNYFCWWD